MKSFARKAAPLAMSVIVLSSSVLTAACSNRAKGKAEKVAEDAPWFNVSSIELGTQYNTEDYEYFYQYVMGMTGDKIVVTAQGSLPFPDQVDEDFDYESLYVENLDIYDSNGNLLNSIDINDLFRDELGSSFYLGGINITGDEITADVHTWDSMTGEDGPSYEAVIDAESGTVSDLTEVTDDDEQMSSEGNVYFDGYMVAKYWISGEHGTNSYLIEVYKDDEELNTIDLREQLANEDVYDISTVNYLGGGRALVCYSDSETYKHDKFFLMDLEAGTAEKCTEDMSWFSTGDDYYRSAGLYSDELGAVISDTEGVKIVDYDNKQLEMLMDFSDSNVNRSDIQDMQLLSCTNDRIVYSGTLWNVGSYMTGTSIPCIFVFERAESNPNAGKTILNAAVAGYIDRATAEAVVRFNDTNPDYFIRYTNRYDLSKFRSDVNSSGDEATTELAASAAMSNQLAMDLMSGDGPDLIFNMLSYSQLNNADYLVDLSDMITEEGYYSHIFDACRTDDKLYQIPLNFVMSGIWTDASNLESDQYGFTYDQYVDFVDTVCNGEDPLQMDKITTFTTMLSGMTDLFRDENGRINYDNEAFRTLAQYVNDNVTYVEPDYSEYGEYVEYYLGGPEMTGAEWKTVDSVGSLLYGSGSSAQNMRLAGIPSVDGRGPSVEIRNSIGISASSPSVEGCRELINILLSTEIQAMYCELGSTCVSTEGFRQGSEEEIEYYNRQIQRMQDSASYEEIAEMGMDYQFVDDSFLDEFDAMVESCGSVSFIDPAVMSIVREEMPAYFEGQKTIDEVIEILQNRVNTYTNERG